MEIYSVIDKLNNVGIQLFVTIMEGQLHKVVRRDVTFFGERNYFSELVSTHKNTNQPDEIISAIMRSDFLKSEIPPVAIGQLEILKLDNTFGEFHPRVFRPMPITPHNWGAGTNRLEELENKVFEERAFDPNNSESIVNSINQLSILLDDLRLILETVRPDEVNFDVYGDKIKNLLVMSCIEVENQFKGILASNSYSNEDRLNTTDFVKLKDILKLDRYVLRFNYFPNISEQRPFKDWDSSCATKSIEWYNSYNTVKHNSEKEISKATLGMALSSISALAILIISQYGYNPNYWRERIGNFFQIYNETRWSLSDFIFPPLNSGKWNEKKLEIG